MKEIAKRIVNLSGVFVLAGCAVTPASLTTSPVASAGQTRTVSSSAAGQYALGKYYLGENRAALALIAFSNALALDSANTEAANGKAMALARLGDVDAAIAELQAVVERAPDHAHLHNNLGFLLLQQPNREMDAADALRKAFALDPANMRVRANWAELLSKLAGDPTALARIGTLGFEAPATAPQVAATVNATADKPSDPVAGITPPTTGSRENAHLSIVNVAIEPARADAVPTSIVYATVSARQPVAPQAAAPQGVSPQPAMARAVPGEPAPLAPARKIMAKVEVFNGNGVNGMARRYGKQLRTDGFQVVRVANATSFQVERTRIQFRDGYMDDAIALGHKFTSASVMVLESRSNARADIRIVLGKDARRSEFAADTPDGPDTLAALTSQEQERN